jgi:hypothetical protein
VFTIYSIITQVLYSTSSSIPKIASTIMSNNVSNNTASASDANSRTNRHTTPGSQSIYQERCADIKAHINVLKQVTATTKLNLESIEKKIIDMENYTEIEDDPETEDRPKIEDLRNKAKSYCRKISAFEAAQNLLAEKSENEWSDEVMQMKQNAKRVGVVFGHEDGGAK